MMINEPEQKVNLYSCYLMISVGNMGKKNLKHGLLSIYQSLCVHRTWVEMFQKYSTNG